MYGVGAMAQAMRVGESIVPLSGGQCGPSTPEEHTRRLVSFVTAGLKAAGEGAKS